MAVTSSAFVPGQPAGAGGGRARPALAGRWFVALIVVGGAGLLGLAGRSYPGFHILVEMGCVVVALAAFTVAYQARTVLRDNYLLLIGIAYVAVAVLDSLHALTYTGIGAFSFGGANVATQFWLAARLV